MTEVDTSIDSPIMPVSEPKNLGFDIEAEEKAQSVDDWVFAGIFKDELDFDFNQKDYLPAGELQYGREDFMDCVTRGYVNIIETYFNYLYLNKKLHPENMKWLDQNGFVIYVNERPYIEISDRFIAMLSHTTRNGNSMKGPADAIRKFGCVSKKMLPASSDMKWDDYHNDSDITREILDVGKEWVKRFPINYERVAKKYWKNVIKELGKSLNVAGYAWPQPVNGIYPRSNGPANHAFMNFKPEWFIFDNYKDWKVDNDWIKQLASDFNFYSYGYRLIFREVVPDPNWEVKADGHTNGKEFKKGDRLSKWSFWYAIFDKTIRGFKAIGNTLGSLIKK